MKMPSQRQITLLAYVPGPNETPQPSCEIFAAHLMAWELRKGRGEAPYTLPGVPGVLVNLRNLGLVKAKQRSWGTPQIVYHTERGWVKATRYLLLWQRTFEI